MSGYTKLFSSIIASTIWREDHETRIVWITMLAMADRYGVVEASMPGLSDLARVSVDGCRRAIMKLAAPDPDSRSHEFDGRRIEQIDGGWRILNHGRYREKLNADDRREYQRKWQAARRAKKKRVDTDVEDSRTALTEVDRVDTVQSTEYRVQSTDTVLVKGADAPLPDPLRIIQRWTEELAPSLPKIKIWTDARRRQLKARWREQPTPEWWRSVLVRIEASDFLAGRLPPANGHASFKADLFWCLKPDNLAKILEGKYDNRPVVAAFAPEPRVSDEAILADIAAQKALRQVRR